MLFLAVVPVVADLRPEQQIGVWPPIQSCGQPVEIPSVACTVPSSDAVDIPGTGNPRSIVIPHPFGSQIGPQARIDLVQQVLIQAVPLSVSAAQDRNTVS
jgi:hypothetical protein